MCGIAGFYASSSDAASDDLLLAMAGELRHRGPDGVGLYTDRCFGMVSTRLSIIDLVGGDQPIPNEDGRYWVMQNGEIYNHVELRATLESHGHRFSTSCDTEVLAHAYEQWGAACLDELNGDFAFAIWDRTTRELFLARDRFGVRPLFVSERGGALAFASEAKALLRDPKVARQLDPVGVVDAFTLWSVLPDRSAFAGIRELPPGHFLRYGPLGMVEERRWWDLRFEPPDPLASGSDDELEDTLRALLSDSIRLRLRADVPVAIYLSGGLDSSAIAAIAGRFASRSNSAFSVGFDDDAFDEGRFQTLAARELRLELHRATVGQTAIGELFPKVVALAERPLLRTAPGPLLALSALVRQEEFKVVLSGEGADEIFAGYDIFKEARVRRFCANEPDSQLRPLLFGRIYPYLRTSDGMSGTLQQQFFRRGMANTSDLLYSHQLRFANGARNLRFMRREFIDEARSGGDSTRRLVARLPEDFSRMSALGMAQYLEATTFLSGYLLHAQGDRMLMGNSVEGRFPYLDHRVAEFAAALPDRLRLRGLSEKIMLRRAAAPYLPDELVRRQKRPYRAPITPAFVGPSSPDYVTELLQPERLEQAGIFEPRQVRLLLGKAQRQVSGGLSENDEMALVGIISTMLLHEQLVARPALATSPVPNRIIRGGATREVLHG